jgi:hypothetical protein
MIGRSFPTAVAFFDADRSYGRLGLAEELLNGREAWRHRAGGYQRHRCVR